MNQKLATKGRYLFKKKTWPDIGKKSEQWAVGDV